MGHLAWVLAAGGLAARTWGAATWRVDRRRLLPGVRRHHIRVPWLPVPLAERLGQLDPEDTLVVWRPAGPLDRHRAAGDGAWGARARATAADAVRSPSAG